MGEVVLLAFQKESGACKFLRYIGWQFHVRNNLWIYFWFHLLLNSICTGLPVASDRGSLCHTHHALCDAVDWNSYARGGLPRVWQCRVCFSHSVGCKAGCLRKEDMLAQSLHTQIKLWLTLALVITKVHGRIYSFIGLKYSSDEEAMSRIVFQD